jgi:hypothetical protein
MMIGDYILRSDFNNTYHFGYILEFPVMKKCHLLLSTIVMSTAILGFASNAKADSIKIMATASCTPWGPFQGDVGHAAIAFYDGNGKLVGTKGMWPVSGSSLNAKTGIWPGQVRSWDGKDVEMANGKGCGLRTRTAYVTRQRREWLQNQVTTVGGTNCQSYLPVGKVGGSEKCSCVNFATRVWRQATAESERWQFQTTPKLLGDTIWWANGRRDSGLFDGGKTWN